MAANIFESHGQTHNRYCYPHFTDEETEVHYHIKVTQ
jgi:hypothetical protein